MPGFLSVVGCRMIPQEVGPLGLGDGPLLWAPVFEILCNDDGSTAFFLHGRERGADYVYPGLLMPVDRTCNVLLLEVEPRHQKNGSSILHSKSFARGVDKEVSRRLSKSDSGISKSGRVAEQKGAVAPFGRLGFGDRRWLLDVVTYQVRQNVPDTSNVLLFPGWRNDEAELQRDVKLLHERRLLLLQMFRYGGGTMIQSLIPSSLKPIMLGSSEVRKNLDSTSCFNSSGDVSQAHSSRGKTFSGFLKSGLKQILRKSSTTNDYAEFMKKSISSSESKHVQLNLFLWSAEATCLSLCAATMKLSSYRSWPNMHDSRFVMYKLPVRAPIAGHEFAGLWEGLLVGCSETLERQTWKGPLLYLDLL